MPLEPTPMAALAGRRTVLLETRRRDGTWVATPVNLAVYGGNGYFQTASDSGKHKRLHTFAQVRVSPHNRRGAPTGPAIAARARPLEGEEAERARALLVARFPLAQGLLAPLVYRRRRRVAVYYQLTPS